MTLQDKFIRYCEEGNLMLVKACLEQGVDVNADNGYAIGLASYNGHLEVVKELIKAGVDINAGNGYGIGLASYYGHIEIVKLLKEHGAEEQ